MALRTPCTTSSSSADRFIIAPDPQQTGPAPQRGEQSPACQNWLLFPGSARAPRDIPGVGYNLQPCPVPCPGCQLCRRAQSWGMQRARHSCQPNKPGLRGQDILLAAVMPLGHTGCIPAPGEGGISDAVSAGAPAGSGKHRLCAQPTAPNPHKSPLHGPWLT